MVINMHNILATKRYDATMIFHGNCFIQSVHESVGRKTTNKMIKERMLRLCVRPQASQLNNIKFIARVLS